MGPERQAFDRAERTRDDSAGRACPPRAGNEPYGGVSTAACRVHRPAAGLPERRAGLPGAAAGGAGDRRCLLQGAPGRPARPVRALAETTKTGACGAGSIKDCRRALSGFRLHLQDLAAPVHPGLQVDMVRTAQLSRVFVLDMGRGLDGVGGRRTRREGDVFLLGTAIFVSGRQRKRPLRAGKHFASFR